MSMKLRLLNIYLKLIQFTVPFKVKSYLSNAQKIYIELGSGPKKGKNGWITIDRINKVDLVWDLSKGIPFPDNSVDRIYSSHLFEHLMYADILKLLSESKRVLKPGGEFSICVPNAKIFLDAYYGINKEKVIKENIWEYGYNYTTKIDLVNYIAYMRDEHKYMFDDENLLFILGKNGFENVKLRDFDPSIDMASRINESLYAVANKKSN
jgi:predicted SAM-dependent methyltransferase